MDLLLIKLKFDSPRGMGALPGLDPGLQEKMHFQEDKPWLLSWNFSVFYI